MTRFRFLAAALLFAAPAASAASLRAFENQFRSWGKPRVNVHDGADEAVARALTYTVFLPFALSAELPTEGCSRGLYVDSRGDAGDASYQQRLELSHHAVGGYIGGWGGRWRLDTEAHVGLEAFWTDYIEHREEDLHFVGASALGDFWREETWRANYQIGAAALSGRATRVGPRLCVEAEWYPMKPFFLDGAAAATFIDGGPLGETRAGGGVAWKRAQVRLSYRSLMGPLRSLDGPELAFIFRL